MTSDLTDVPVFPSHPALSTQSESERGRESKVKLC